MNEQQQSLQDIRAIKQMMERSSRFISLSGFSGISAGICALIGAWVAFPYVYGYKNIFIDARAGIMQAMAGDYSVIFNTWLFWIAVITFCSALILAFIFTYAKSKKQGLPLWGVSSRRLMINVAIPLFAGGIFILKVIYLQAYGLFAPGCLIFYGLALINASKYTLAEIRYLGYSQLILGIINLGFVGLGLYFWAAGFGVMHIVYGAYMWWKYERKDEEQ